jgi:uncharacterized HAD superfamily protein
MNRNSIKIIAIDIDGVLTKGPDCFTEKEILNAVPNKKAIEKVNKLFLNNFVIIYTARRDNLIPATLKWLRKNGVMFQAISNNKMSSDCYIDDRIGDLK